MTKQKLPIGWAFNAWGSAVSPGRLVGISQHGSLQILDERPGLACPERMAPPEIALAVIRNAELDPVFAAAKKMIAYYPSMNRELNALLEQLKDAVEATEEQ